MGGNQRQEEEATATAVATAAQAHVAPVTQVPAAKARLQPSRMPNSTRRRGLVSCLRLRTFRYVVLGSEEQRMQS